ncbi:MAG: YihY/virulence factor BrkB family protein [Dehalococcoidia bacterium]
MADEQHHARSSGPVAAARRLADRISAFARGVQEHWETRTGNLENTWLRVTLESVKNLPKHDATIMAAGVSYYAVLSIFPLTLAILSVAGFFADSEAVRAEIIGFFADYLPQSEELVDRNVNDIVRFRGLFGLFGLLGMFWTGTAILGAINRAVNRAFGIRRDRPIYKSKPRQVIIGFGIGVTIIAILILSILGTTFLSLAAGVNFPVIGRLAFLEMIGVQIVGRLLPLALSLSTFAIIYRWMPNTPTPWRDIWPGIIVAAVLFELAKNAFLFYLDTFAQYEVIYGQLASVVILMVWSYFSALMVIFGAEVAAAYMHIQRQRRYRAPGREPSESAQVAG